VEIVEAAAERFTAAIRRTAGEENIRIEPAAGAAGPASSTPPKGPKKPYVSKAKRAQAAGEEGGRQGVFKRKSEPRRASGR
jgi:hypothetical protein